MLRVTATAHPEESNHVFGRVNPGRNNQPFAVLGIAGIPGCDSTDFDIFPPSPAWLRQLAVRAMELSGEWERVLAARQDAKIGEAKAALELAAEVQAKVVADRSNESVFYCPGCKKPLVNPLRDDNKLECRTADCDVWTIERSAAIPF